MRRRITNVRLWLCARDDRDGDPSIVKYGLFTAAIAAVVVPAAIASGFYVERLFTIAL
jgi:hypothetical protein